MHNQRALATSFSLLFLAACGGGTTNQSFTPLPQNSTVSQSVGASGGTFSVTFGADTATFVVPAGALASTATVRATLYAASSLPTPLSKLRRPQNAPTSATALAGLTIDTGGVALSAPIQVSFAGLAAPGAGQSVMLEGAAASGVANDVAATAFANGTYSETTNPKYPGVTLAASTSYVLYSAPTTSIAAPTAVVTVAGPATVSTSATGTYIATEATANGFPFLGRTFTYSTDSPSLGTIVPTTGVLTGSGTGGAGNVIATESASTFTGKAAVSVTSSRPGFAGLTETYAGTMTQTIVNNVIGGPSPAPAPSVSTVSNVTVSVTTAAGASGNTVFTANETDVAPLLTTTSKTVSTVDYHLQTDGTYKVRALDTVATESSGVIYEHNYQYVPTSTNGLMTVLPETAGTFAIDPAEEYKETDPGIGFSLTSGQGVTTDRKVELTGAYAANIVEPDVNTGLPVTDQETMNADFSGFIAFTSIDPTFQLSFAAPSGGTIAIAETDPSIPLNSHTSSPNWLGTTPQNPTVSIASATLPSGCTSSVTPPATVLAVTQANTVYDSVNGTKEVSSYTSYDGATIGTYCIVVSAAISTFYDFSGQEGHFITITPSATNPLILSTVNETLVLQGSNVASVASTGRSTQAVTPRAMAPIHGIVAHAQHVARESAMKRLQQFRSHASSLLRGGSVK